MPLECERIREWREAFLNGDLSARNADSVASHLEECVGCQEHYGEFDELESRISDELGAAPIPDGLWERVASMPTEPAARDDGWLLRWRLPIGLAASVLVVGLVWLVRGEGPVPGHRLMATPLEELRTFLVSKRPLDLETTDPRALSEWFREHLGDAPTPPELASQSLRLIGGRLCYFFDRRVPVYMYESEGTVVSVYLITAQGIDLKGSDTGVVPASYKRTLERRGLSHIAWKSGDTIVSVVAELSPKRLAGLVSG
ncbi:MAG: zf-HC2 domain-containing protein [Gammaproteobacteria bacterium]|nr:zf-HC2 domain-containing protein [Gammaproteobacteria bacterium]